MVFAFVEQQTKERLLNIDNSQTEFDKSYAKHLATTSSHVKYLIMSKTEWHATLLTSCLMLLFEKR